MQRHFHRQQPPAKAPAAADPKPILPMVQLPIFRVHYHRPEEYLVKVYCMEGFDFLRATGAEPGLVPEYAVGPALDAACQAEAIRAGRRTQNVSLILNVLCIDGYIPAGKDIIDTHLEPPAGQVYRALLQKTGDPTHPECVAFKREHRHERAFAQLAVRMDEAVLESKRAQK